MSVISLSEIRLFLNDFATTNKILRDVEFSSERVHNAIKHVIDDWNETPPLVSNYTEDNFPYKTTLLYGVISFLLSSESISQERNHLVYQSGGLTVDDTNHSEAYMQLSNQFQMKYKELMERQKKVENWEGAWTIKTSGYFGS